MVGGSSSPSRLQPTVSTWLDVGLTNSMISLEEDDYEMYTLIAMVYLIEINAFVNHTRSRRALLITYPRHHPFVFMFRVQ